MKILTAKQVKRLPVGTDIYMVNEKTGEKGMLWIVKSGREKRLKGVSTVLDIKDRAGWRYEVEEEQ